jgi:hypothetical protein
MPRMEEPVTDRWSRFKKALNKRLPDWLDKPFSCCCLFSDCLTVLSLLAAAGWLVKKLAVWLR